MKKKKNIQVLGVKNIEISSDERLTLLEALLQKKVDWDHLCGGGGSCGTCRVIVEEGLENLPHRNAVEKEMAEARGFSKKERLACQIPAIGPLLIRKKDS